MTTKMPSSPSEPSATVKPIQNLLICGTGAVGGAYAKKIADHDPTCLRILARGNRKHRYKQDGLIINDQRYDFNLADPEAPEPQAADLILVAVKDYGLTEAIQDMTPFVGPQTLILSLMNGITSEARLAEAFGHEKVLYGLVMSIDGARDQNRIRFTQYGTISFGYAINTEIKEEVQSVAAFFDKVGISYNIPENMQRELWYKFMVNVGINQASAVVRGGFGAFQTIPEAHALMRSAMWELIRITEKNGIHLSEKDLENWDKVLMAMPPGSRPSMLNDLENGRKTEVEMLSGAIMALGAQYNVPTPVNEALYRIIKSAEALTEALNGV
ncbi:ketopantoate reductase family protein [Acidaminobacter hydrogenoformans]|uniref:2-dehydropantoate 2-reductase n=1 Tax=Acidaminobacter hydrogenoformans DSM 2784 TaxID=1120920 RepID=A0A1G5RZU4_9FIRM|nr:ketopantoate reductase family protein [Acidaminobacter hydrogenoformans]SCZ79632.1 ketopantoate reductase [Acidaminobacter hydrogenoformans DSM 2784]